MILKLCRNLICTSVYIYIYRICVFTVNLLSLKIPLSTFYFVVLNQMSLLPFHTLQALIFSLMNMAKDVIPNCMSPAIKDW